MLWYLVKEPTMTHASSMASVAGFTWMWAATRDRRTLRQWAAPRTAGRLDGADSLAEPALRASSRLDARGARVRPPGAARTRARCETPVARQRDLSRVPRSSAFCRRCSRGRSIYGSLIARSPVGPQIRWTRSAPRRHPVVGAQRPVQHLADPLPGRDRSRGLRDRAARRRPAAAARRVRRDDLLQRLHPGLVGQRRIWRAAIRRHDPAASALGLGRVRRVRRRVVRRHALAAVFAVASAVRRLEPRADGGSAERRCSASARRCRSTAHGAIRRGSSTAGSAIRSATRRASPSRCETAFRRVTTICSRPTGSSAILCSPTGDIDLGERRRVAARRTAGTLPERDGAATFRWAALAGDAADSARSRGAASRAGAAPRVRVRGRAAADADAPGQSAATPAGSCDPLARRSAGRPSSACWKRMPGDPG